MISTTRKTTNTEEKSVSFSRRPSNRIYVDDYEVEASERLPEARIINVPKLDFAPQKTEKEIEYSSRNVDTYTVPKIKLNAVPLKREREDVMPTIKAEKRQEVQKEKQSVSFHSKLMLAIYVAVVVILAAVVIGTGYAITNTTNNVSSLENELLSRNELAIQYSQRLELLDDMTYNAGRGVEIGMEKIDSYVEVDLVDEIAQVEFNANTNWFDKFCDFLSKMLK